MREPRTVREPGAWQCLWREGLGAHNQHGEHDDHPHYNEKFGEVSSSEGERATG